MANQPPAPWPINRLPGKLSGQAGAAAFYQMACLVCLAHALSRCFFFCRTRSAWAQQPSKRIEALPCLLSTFAFLLLLVLQEREVPGYSSLVRKMEACLVCLAHVLSGCVLSSRTRSAWAQQPWKRNEGLHDLLRTFALLLLFLPQNEECLGTAAFKEKYRVAHSPPKHVKGSAFAYSIIYNIALCSAI